MVLSSCVCMYVIETILKRDHYVMKCQSLKHFQNRVLQSENKDSAKKLHDISKTDNLIIVLLFITLM